MLNNKVSLVTGGAQGIGKAIATVFARNRCNVILCDIDEGKVKSVAEELENNFKVKCLGMVADVSDFTQCQKMVEKAIETFERIDILVNNAGITRDQLLLKMSDEEWDTVMAVNLKGAFNCCRAVVRHMIRQRSGRIINISSVVGISGNPGQVNYSASKAGLIGLSKTLAKELASRDITVNAVAPGFIQTRMTDSLSDSVKKNIVAQIPLQRFGQPEDVANLVLFLASDLASYITGEVIKVDGGLMM
ncbi:3-oxoacyl-[acyl-carrier-protein] reductase [Candidatus Sumerlaeota bacterium]|nr:3-oxoacyl-[acyl-carrier-protein] reductase [Candidatus Sumerlaeota bacterium]